MNPAYGFIAVTVVCTVAGQLVIKWQTGKAGPFPAGTEERLRYLLDFMLNPWVIGSFAGALVAAFAWIAALSHLELSRAYPFVSASFALVLVLSAIIFAEPLTAAKIVGAVLIIVGLIVGSQG